jgi:transcriptional regulator with XRE-family HTH domain
MEMVMLDEETRLAIKTAILRRGLHQYQVGQAIGMNEYRLSAILSGRRSVPSAKLDELRAFLGMEPAEVGIA